MAARGPRGGITQANILRAVVLLLAAEIGVAVNALYTYFPSLDVVWHDLADERMGCLEPQALLDDERAHCTLPKLADRAVSILSTPSTISLPRQVPVPGHSPFVLSETIMAPTEHRILNLRDAHDLVVGWFYGSVVLEGESWTSGTDAIRSAETFADLPRIAGRSQRQNAGSRPRRSCVASA